MSSVIKSYVSIILIILSFIVSIGLISMTVDIQNARDFQDVAISEIENSDHNPNVIKAIKTDAQNNGYLIDIKTVDTGTGETVTKVTLTYSYKFDFLNISNQKTITGYAR